MAVIFDKEYMQNADSKKLGQWDSVESQRNVFLNAQRSLAGMPGLSNQDIVANTGIGVKDFWQEVDRQIQGVRKEYNSFMNDLAGIATPLPIGVLSYVNVMSGDVTDDVQITMDMQPEVKYENIGAQTDRNPVPGFMAGVGINYRKYQGQQREALDLFMQAQRLKTAVVMEKIADYSLDGSAKVKADGQVGEGIKNHRNTLKIDLGPAGYNIDLTTCTVDEFINFWTADVYKILDENILEQMDRVFVSPEIKRRLDQPLSKSDGFKSGTIGEEIMRYGRVEQFIREYKLSGNEWFGYRRNREIISPLIELPVTAYPEQRISPFQNYNVTIAGVQGIKITKTLNNKYGVFYASKVS